MTAPGARSLGTNSAFLLTCSVSKGSGTHLLIVYMSHLPNLEFKATLIGFKETAANKSCLDTSLVYHLLLSPRLMLGREERASLGSDAFLSGPRCLDDPVCPTQSGEPVGQRPLPLSPSHSASSALFGSCSFLVLPPSSIVAAASLGRGSPCTPSACVPPAGCGVVLGELAKEAFHNPKVQRKNIVP